MTPIPKNTSINKYLATEVAPGFKSWEFLDPSSEAYQNAKQADAQHNAAEAHAIPVESLNAEAEPANIEVHHYAAEQAVQAHVTLEQQ